MTPPLKHSNIDEKIRKNQFEMTSWSLNKAVCGIDEVGRGCLAGPVVTAAVILPPHKTSPLLKDSKLLTPEERQKAFAWIHKNCWYGVGILHNRLIDRHNIRQATRIAMKKALMHVLAISPHKPASILIDALPLELTDTSYSGIPVYYFPFGEKKSSSIAAASIVAKVRRDAIMTNFEALFPGFNLHEHKGYSTEKHKEILMRRKHSLIHRMSFLNNITHAKETNDHEKSQQTLC